MDKAIMEKLGNMSLLGYYDEDLKMLCVHFFGDGGRKDLMAYLKSDYSWDLREVVRETATLYDDKEVVEITHNRLAVYDTNSPFDKMVRSALQKMMENEGFKDEKVENILTNGYEE